MQLYATLCNYMHVYRTRAPNQRTHHLLTHTRLRKRQAHISQRHYRQGETVARGTHDIHALDSLRLTVRVTHCATLALLSLALALFSLFYSLFHSLTVLLVGMRVGRLSARLAAATRLRTRVAQRRGQHRQEVRVQAALQDTRLLLQD